MVEHLREAISRITDWKFELMTEIAADGTLVGLITVEKDLSDKVKKSLSDEHVPELIFPPSFSGLSFSEKVAYVKKRIAEVSVELDLINTQHTRFAQRWIPIYQTVKDWINDRLSLLAATTATFETRLCFFINGWMSSQDVDKLRNKLVGTFNGDVILDEKEMREEDLERVPIILKNPPYFKPFELFTSLLPLPAYTSYDPTPFIGIFFPVFFGMILGDAGYGLVLAAVSVVLMKKFRHQGMVRDGARILMAASLYSLFFGVLFGEFFGDLPERLFHLSAHLHRTTRGRHDALFRLTVGVAHILLGLLLGAITGFRKHERRKLHTRSSVSSLSA
jgi:V/A-type H+-transporting ATPase subunit I